MSPYPAQDYYADMKRRELQTQIDRTKTGLLLLVIGLIIGSLPFVSFIGGLLNIIGAILVILGRNAFGPQHSRNASVSLILYIGGAIVAGIGTAVFVFSIVSSRITGTVDQASITSAFQIFLATIVAQAAISGIAIVLFTYQLQKQMGRILLWVGYALSIAISVVTFAYISSILASSIASAFASGTYNPAPLQDLQSEASAFSVLGLIPAIIYAIAYYIARERILRGEIPILQQPYDRTAMPPATY